MSRNIHVNQNLLGIFWFCVLLALVTTGCRLIQGAADLPGGVARVVLPGGKKGQTVDLVELQQTLMRYSGEVSAGVVAAADQLSLGPNPPPPVRVLQRKINFCREIWAIASGQNTVANVLDMVSMINLTRMAAEDQWIAEGRKESAQPMLNVLMGADTNIWRIAARILSPVQQEELKSAILATYSSEADPESWFYVRAYGTLSPAAGKGKQAERTDSGGVLGLLMIDPLSGLNPATQELTQTRLFGERAMFLAQRMPQLLRWETELWTLNSLQIPEVQQLITNSTELSKAVERTSRVTEELPDRLSQEREQMVAALESQQSSLTTLATEMRDALLAGSQMASNVNLALTTFDGLTQSLDSGPPSTNDEPFRIQDYTEAITQADATVQDLRDLLLTLNGTLDSSNLLRLSGELDTLLQGAQLGGQTLVDHTHRRAIQLIAIACGSGLVAALLYRLVAFRLTRRRIKPDPKGS